MSADHLAARGVKPSQYYLRGPGFGVRTERGAPAMEVVGEYKRGGAAGAYYWAAPAEEMFAV